MDGIEIEVNGERVLASAQSSIALLIESRGLTGKRVAIEVNGEVVPRGRHAERLLRPGDRVEIVFAVGGG